MFKKQKLKVVEQIEQNINDAMIDMQSGTWSGANGKEHCDLYISGLRHAINVIHFNTAECEGKVYHPTKKPVTLCEYLIKTYTNKGETVLDNCIGSGTTAIACMNTNRNYIGFEMDNTYFNIANKRVKDYLHKLKTA